MYRRQGKFADAEALAIGSYEGHAKTLGDAHPHTLLTIRLLANLYGAWRAAEPDGGYDAKAAEWRAMLEAMQPAATQPQASP